MPDPGGGLLPGDTLFPGGTGLFTTQILTSFAAWLQDDPDGALNNLLVAYASMAEQVFGIVSDTGSPDIPVGFTAGWSVLLDPDNCPAAFIPYGAQFVGVQIPTGTDAADARALWKANVGFRRGTPAAIIATAKLYLTGTQSVLLLERLNGDAYQCEVRVAASELTVLPNVLNNALLAVKPAGIILNFDDTAGAWHNSTSAWSSYTGQWSVM